MSGFFMLRRELIDRHAHELSGIGYKILLDIVLTAGPAIRLAEIPYTFRLRSSGESKISARVVWEYLLLLADKAVGRFIPLRFLAFSAIGAMGVATHFVILALLFEFTSVEFIRAQAFATALTIVFNYALNNLLTYSDRRLQGWRWCLGFLSFGLICGFGALANVGVASYLFYQRAAWPLAALAGIGVSAVWNYGVSARFTWRVGK
jgi:dolichol-phosphate mannosyltransferase